MGSADLWMGLGFLFFVAWWYVHFYFADAKIMSGIINLNMFVCITTASLLPSKIMFFAETLPAPQ